MTTEAALPSHPIQLTLGDDLKRNRITVLFRLILAIPHFIWLWLWGIVVYFAVIGNWFATLFGGRSPEGLHNFIARYLRYLTHVRAYLYFLADPYPGFMGDDAYPTDITIAGPTDQNRWITGFRLILGIPALIVAGVLSYVAQVLAFFAWIVCLFAGAMPEGFRDILGWVLRFEQQTNGYMWILTDRYPSFSTDPEA